MKLVVGLGNPGPDYEKTRHNIGFEFVDYLVRQLNCSFTKEKFKSLYTQTQFNEENVYFIKPQTYMNLSGESLVQWMAFFHLEPSDVWVVHDELDLAFGEAKFVKEAGAAGHRGVLSIQQLCGTNKIPRLRMGIGKPIDKRFPIAEYVLQKFSKQEQDQMQTWFDAMYDVFKAWMNSDLELAMQLSRKRK